MTKTIKDLKKEKSHNEKTTKMFSNEPKRISVNK